MWTAAGDLFARCEAMSSPAASAAFAGHRRPDRCSRCTAASPPRRGTSPEVRGRLGSATPLLCQERLRPPQRALSRSPRGALVGAPVARSRFAGPRFSRYLCWRSQLRHSSRLTVDTARPSSVAVAVKRAAIPVQIGDRDPLLQSVRYRTDDGLDRVRKVFTGGYSSLSPALLMTVRPYRQRVPVRRFTPTIRQASELPTPCWIKPTNRSRFPARTSRR